MLIQKVGTEDVFLGLSGKDPSSVNCDGFTVKIKLPGCTMKDIQVDVKKQSIHIQSSKYVLNHTLPHPVDKENGKAKWDSDKQTLILELPAVKQSIIDALMEAPKFD